MSYAIALRCRKCGREHPVEPLTLCDFCFSPTCSFKDRVVSVAITKAREFGFDTVACASIGNLAASVAAHAAKANIKSYVFVPSDVEPGKLTGIAIYNPVLVTAKGSYDDVNRLCSQLVQRYNWGFIPSYSSPPWNPSRRFLVNELESLIFHSCYNFNSRKNVRRTTWSSEEQSAPSHRD